MWPFSDISLEWATWWGELANIALLVCLIGGVLATFAIVRTTNVKEHHWDSLRSQAKTEFDRYKIGAAKEIESVRSDADAKIGVAREEARKAVDQAQADIAKSNARSDEANARAAEAIKAAETEKLERIKLEAQIAPRRLEGERHIALTSAMGQYAGRRVAVVSYALDAEAVPLAFQIINSLERAKLVVREMVASEMVMGNFGWGVHVSGPDKELVGALRVALANAAGLIVAPEQNTVPPLSSIGPQSGQPVAAFVLVGVKPIQTRAKITP